MERTVHVKRTELIGWYYDNPQYVSMEGHGQSEVIGGEKRWVVHKTYIMLWKVEITIHDPSTSDQKDQGSENAMNACMQFF